MPDVGSWRLAFNVCDSKSGLTYTGVKVCTLHKTSLLTVGWQLICLIMCTAQVFKINYPIHLISLSVQTYSVTIKIKENYLLKYNFIATEIAETSLLKHFILSHDIAQSKHIWRHIINLFSSKNKHLETGNQDTSCSTLWQHITSIMLAPVTVFSKLKAPCKKKKVYCVITQIHLQQMLFSWPAILHTDGCVLKDSSSHLVITSNYPCNHRDLDGPLY